MTNFLNDITFANKWAFWLLLVLLPLIGWYIYKNLRRSAHLLVPRTKGLESVKPTLRQRLRHLPFAFRVLTIALLIIALARPQSSSSWKNITTEGIDIILSMDISGSMLAQDFKPNRLEVAKEVAMEFIDSRVNDRIGLVIFSGESFTQCPLTSDHDVIKNLFESIQTGMLEDGTAIGSGLATSVSRLKDSKAKSKVVILLTDGVNTQGSITPINAAEIAKMFNIRVYTIGVGRHGKALSPVALDPVGNYVFDYVEVKIDEKMMQKIASLTGGKYFRATDKSSLKNIYREIDKMEKTIVEEKNFVNREERFLPYAMSAGFLLLLEFLVKNLLLRSIP